jgi:hypothetical protein
MRTRHITAALGILVLAAAIFASPAYADPHGGQGNEHGGNWNRGHGGWEENRWAHHDVYGHPGYGPGYYAPPPVYYGPQPQPYYAPPGINLFLPFR